MIEYLVTLQSPADIERLRDDSRISKVGKPRALRSRVIIETDLTIGEVAELPGVVGVERGDDPVQKSFAVSDASPDGWALPWISNSGGTYEHSRSGEGVDIYVLDDGIRPDHVEFLPGQVETIHSRDGLDYFDDPDDPSPWHGTAVASCAAGQSLGVARDAHVLNLRVKWTVSGIIKALDVAVRHHLDKPDDRPSVLNFSGSSLSSQLGDAFADAVSYGIVAFAASGNDYEDLPRYPARELWTVAVGALREDGSRASFSNLRAEVYAPGQGITMAGVTSTTALLMANGTSFASPYAAGIAACNLEGSHKFNSRSLVSDLNWALRNNVWMRDKVEPFDNGGYTVRCASTNTVPMPHYTNPSLAYTDAEIAWFVTQNMHQPQVIADAALDGNVSLKRLAGAMGYTEQQVDDWFASHGVDPWWATAD